MDEWIKVFSSWPIIVQGALGSALFWLILALGQRAVSFVSDRYTGFSRIAKVSKLTDLQAKYLIALTKEHALTGAYVSVLIYRSLRHFFRAFLWLTVGLLLQSLAPIIGVIAYVGSLYYFFGAVDVVRPVDTAGAKEKLEKVTMEIEELQKHQKTKKPKSVPIVGSKKK